MNSFRPCIEKCKILFTEYRRRKYYKISSSYNRSGHLRVLVGCPENTIGDMNTPSYKFTSKTFLCYHYMKEHRDLISYAVDYHYYIDNNNVPYLSAIIVDKIC